jgi:hypothetical protein
MQAAEQPSEAPAEKISKADAVRAAMAEGNDTPEEGVAFISKRFGVEVTRQQFSSYKSQEKARQQKKGGQEENGQQGKRAVEAPVAEVVPAPRNGTPDVAESIQAIKSLVDTLGVDQVKQIAEIFRK